MATTTPAKREHTAPAHAAHTASHAAAKPATHTAAAKTAPAHKGKYHEAVGRRKTAIARVRIFAGKGGMTVNGMDVKKYFSLDRLVAAAVAPLKQLQLGDIDVTVKVSGGGIHAQAEAIRLGLSRAIVSKDGEWKPRLRAVGFLTRDPRMVERKKYGLKKARRAPQWAKR